MVSKYWPGAVSAPKNGCSKFLKALTISAMMHIYRIWCLHATSKFEPRTGRRKVNALFALAHNTIYSAPNYCLYKDLSIYMAYKSPLTSLRTLNKRNKIRTASAACLAYKRIKTSALICRNTRMAPFQKAKTQRNRSTYIHTALLIDGLQRRGSSGMHFINN